MLPFIKLCQERQIEHGTALVKEPWTNGRVERRIKKIKASSIAAELLNRFSAFSRNLSKLYSDIDL